MANGNPSNEERTRLNPEFSLGERLATMEANQAKGEQYAKVAEGLMEKLSQETFKAVRQEMSTKDTAQKEAIGKAEKAAGEAATALATELRTSRETTDARLGALERGGATGVGEKTGSGEYERRIQAEQKARNAQYVLYVAIATLLYFIASGQIH
jgi:hypothetical protein